VLQKISQEIFIIHGGQSVAENSFGRDVTPLWKPFQKETAIGRKNPLKK